MSRYPTFVRILAAGSLLSLFGIGCHGTGESPTEIRATSSTAAVGTEGVECRHEYYPLVPGYRALYRTTINGVDKGSYSITVPWVRNNAAYLQAEFTSAGGDAVTKSSQEFRCHNGALEAQGYVDLGDIQPGGSDFNKAEVHTDSTSGSFFPKTVSVGASWESTVKIMMTPKKTVDAFGIEGALKPVTIVVVTRKRAVGMETVRLPIGARQAMKIEVTTLFDGVPTFSKVEWWVKDIGMVKSFSWASVLESDPPVITEMNDYVVPSS